MLIAWMTKGKMETKAFKLFVYLLLAIFLFSACTPTAEVTESLPGQTLNEDEPEMTDSMDLTYNKKEGIEVI